MTALLIFLGAATAVAMSLAGAGAYVAYRCAITAHGERSLAQAMADRAAEAADRAEHACPPPTHGQAATGVAPERLAAMWPGDPT